MMVGETDKETRKEIEKSIKKDVAKVKRRLIRQAKKQGLWENFGQKEFRDLSDKYFQHIHDNVNTEPIFDFQEWSMNYDGRDERYL